jgi:HSP90 family molecular chaperone
MANEPTFVTIGSPTDKIDVRLSYRIIELFSEGLYASPNKAVEELVANAFDAGAQTVQVILSTNLHDQDATIVVVDDGEGMGVEGLKRHWLIGISNKRRLGDKLPMGRQQIGQFGIGKLATYVLSSGSRISANTTANTIQLRWTITRLTAAWIAKLSRGFQLPSRSAS